MKKWTKPTKRKLSSPVIQQLRILSDQIGNIIPATAFGRTPFCFQAIAKSYHLRKYWMEKGVKKELIFEFLKRVYQNHPRLFYKIFRENLPRGIERRYRTGKPVLLAEIEELNKTLRKLKVNLSREIKALNLPVERPKIVPPPFIFQKMIDDLSLHLTLQPNCPQLFKDGHINESVRKALEKYEKFVQNRSALTFQGKNLMAQVFDENNPKISIADTSSVRGKSIQEGFKFVSMGAMEFWRNFFSHGDEPQVSHLDAIAVLATISHLLNYIDSTNTSS